jgi:hypothetical protein
MLKKTIGIMRLDLFNAAVAISSAWITIRIFYLIFLFSQTIEGETIVRQIPNHITFSMVVGITYLILRFAAVAYKNSGLNNHKKFSFVCGNILFGIGYVIFLGLVSAVEDEGGGTKALLPLVIVTIGIPSLLISLIVNLFILYQVALSWIRPLREE